MHHYINSATRSDRFGFNTSDEHKLQDLCRQLKFPLDDIMKAVQEVGFDKDEVEEYIRDRYNRSL